MISKFFLKQTKRKAQCKQQIDQVPAKNLKREMN